MIKTVLCTLWFAIGLVFGGLLGSSVGFVWVYASARPGQFHNTDEIYAAQDVGANVGGLMSALLGGTVALLVTHRMLKPNEPTNLKNDANRRSVAP